MTCGCCGRGEMTVFYQVNGVPTNSALLIKDRRTALEWPRGDIALALCQACGIIVNTAFDAELARYGADYEGTQAFSPTFNRFHQHLAERLVERHDLHGKSVVEIGFGQGEFLRLLCDAGGNRGLGFDPAYRGGADGPTIRIEAAEYTEAFAGHGGDFICCKMTLEHIRQPEAFVRAVRHNVGDDRSATVFFQVPDTERVLAELAFWDIYYEHCCYFTVGSLKALFRHCGFEVMGVGREYDGQYLTIEARPARAALPESDDVAETVDAVARFTATWPARREAWRRTLGDLGAAGRRVALWGGGSKAVAFLTTLGVNDEVAQVVDINPNKHDTYLPATGHRVLSPTAMAEDPPDVVIAMNPIYLPEIGSRLAELGVGAELVPVTDLESLQ